MAGGGEGVTAVGVGILIFGLVVAGSTDGYSVSGWNLPPSERTAPSDSGIHLGFVDDELPCSIHGVLLPLNRRWVRLP